MFRVFTFLETRGGIRTILSVAAFVIATLVGGLVGPDELVLDAGLGLTDFGMVFGGGMVSPDGDGRDGGGEGGVE